MDGFFAVDLHGDILMDVLHRRRMLSEDRVLVRHHLDALRAGHVRVQVLPIYVESRYQPEGVLRQAMLMIQSFFEELKESDGAFRFVRQSGDLAGAPDPNVIAVILAFEGAEPLGRDVGLVDVFYELGIRMMGLTWNRVNVFAEGALEDTGRGLSTLGRDLVARASRAGIVLDVSHLNRQSFWDVLEFSHGPVLASHSNAAALWDHRRNLTDDQIKALAARGGLIGLNFVPRFVGPGNLLEGLARHAEHVAGLAGIEHLALGPDFTDYLAHMGVFESKAQRLERPDEPKWPDEQPTVRLLPSFYQALRDRGFSEADARAVMSDNALAYLRGHLPGAR